MVRDLYNALPAVERMLLDTELEGLALGNNPSAAKPQLNGPSLIPPPTTAADMTMSWEEIPRPNGTPAATSLHVIIPPAPVIPIPERSGTPRFGGPIPSLRASTSAPAAIAPAPLIPISTPTGRGLNLGPRKSFPLSTTSVPFASPGSKLPTPKASFTQTAQLFLSGSGGSVGSATKFLSIPQPAAAAVAAPFPSTSNGIGQAPASRKQNAFYNPPPPKKQGSAGTKRAFEVVEEPEPVRDVEMDDDEEDVTRDGEGEDKDLDVHRGREKKRRSRRREVDEEREEEDGFRYSVFGNGNGPHVQPAPGHKGIAPVTEKPSRRLPPGAFTSDEEEAHEDEDEEIPAPPLPPARGTRPTRQSARTAAVTAAPAPPQPAKTTRRSAKAVKDKDLGRSLPGSLIDEGEDEEDEYVAPLRHPSPAHRRSARKARASTPSDVGDGDGAEGGGVQTRRRSSRLSSAHAPSVSPEPLSPAAKKRETRSRKSAVVTVKKSAAASTRKRR